MAIIQKNNIPFIVAEISANHGGKLEVAIETVRAAKRAGADAIKLQTYTADTLTIKSDASDFLISQGTIWDGGYLYDLYEEAHTPWEWHAELFKVAAEEGMICFSTPFDVTAVDFLESLGNPIYKIASFEITDIPLIEYAASKQKPMIISTGIAEYEDITRAINACREVGNDDVTLLKCTSSYPARIEDMNIKMIGELRDEFGVRSGLSDHSEGFLAAVVATALGAVMIEKHFILDKAIGGPDASFSMDEEAFKNMVKNVREAKKALGKIDFTLDEKSLKNREFAKSIYVVKNIEKGQVLTKDNIKVIRPGFGLHPKYYKEIIGKRVNKALNRGDRLELKNID